MCSKDLCGCGWLSCVWVWHIMFCELHSTVCLQVIENKSIVSPTNRNGRKTHRGFSLHFCSCLLEITVWNWKTWKCDCECCRFVPRSLYCSDFRNKAWLCGKSIRYVTSHSFPTLHQGLQTLWRTFFTANTVSWRKMRTTRHDAKHTDSNCFKEQSWNLEGCLHFIGVSVLW